MRREWRAARRRRRPPAGHSRPARLGASRQVFKGLPLLACRTSRPRASDRLRLGKWTVRPPARPVGWGMRAPCGPRPQPPWQCSSRGAGGRTAVADYRTRAKRVSDSPHQGVDRREPRRTIGRAEGLFDSSDEALPPSVLAQDSGRPGARKLQANKNKQQRIQSRPESARERKSYPIEMSREFVRRLWIRGMDTVTVGVTTGVSIGVSIGTAGVGPERWTLQAPRNFRMRASTSARGRPKRMRLVAIRRCGLDRRARGASCRSSRIGEVGVPPRNSRAQAVKFGRSSRASGPPKPICLDKDQGVLGTGAAGDDRSGIAEHG